MVYILKHPEKGFTGFFAGVGFHNGTGSTSDKNDAQRLVKQFKCEDITGKQKAPNKKASAEPAKEEKKK